MFFFFFFVFFQAEDGIRDDLVTGVQTCALPICTSGAHPAACTNAIFGGDPSDHPSARNSSNAFRRPTTPVPPPVGNTTQSGKPPSCSHSSYPIVFFPSTRYGSCSVAMRKYPSFWP